MDEDGVGSRPDGRLPCFFAVKNESILKSSHLFPLSWTFALKVSVEFSLNLPCVYRFCLRTDELAATGRAHETRTLFHGIHHIGWLLDPERVLLGRWNLLFG